MTVKELIEKLKQFPEDAEVVIEVFAYYYEGDRWDGNVGLEDPDPEYLASKNRVVLATIYAQP